MRFRHVGTLSAVALLLGLPGALVAQTGTVRGRIIDAVSNQPLSDVQVRVENTTMGTLSGANGEYVLSNIPAGQATISARRVGYAATRQVVTVPAGGEVTQDFALRVAAVTLDEVVSTGVAAPAARRTVGNAVETVSAEEVNQAPGAVSIDQALQGKVTGALITENSGQPGGGVSVRLRGTGSILGGAEPLYVVDGVIVDNSSAALISIGANAGRGNAALTNRIGDIEPQDVERIEVLKGAAAAALYGSRANNGVIQIFTKRGQSGRPQVRFTTQASVSETPNRYELNDSPVAGFGDVNYFGARYGFGLGDPVTRFDLQDAIFRTGFGTENNLSISGGSERTTYYLSGAYTAQEGIIERSDFTRTSARANVGQQLTERLDVNLRGNYIRSRSNFTPEGEQGYGVLTAAIFTPTVYDPRYDPATATYPSNPVLVVNPIEILDEWRTPETVTRFTGSFDGTFRPLDGLSVRYLAGIDDYRREATFYQPPRSLSPSFTGLISNPMQVSRQFNNDLVATYAAALTPSLATNSTLGFRYTDNRNDVLAIRAEDLPPGQFLVGGARQFASQEQSHLRTIAWFVEERVDINDRLYLTGGVNWEASSAFGADERLQAFPRASASYVLGEEPFFREQSWNPFSSLRLRAAYGETGGQPPGLYSRFSNYIGESFAGLPTLRPSTILGNPEIRPERQREYEFGFDAGVLEDRVQMEFSYYDKLTTDLVLQVPLPPSRGFSFQFQNVGELTNKGVEVALNTVNMSRPSFTWRSRLQYAANRNEVTKLNTSADTLVTGYLNAVIEGHPVGVFYGGIYARDANGAIIYTDTTIGTNTYQDLPFRDRDVLPNGSLVLANRIIGDPNPDFTLSLGNTFEIGSNMQLNVLLDGRFGNDVADFSRRISQFFGAHESVEREISGDTAARTFTLNPTGRINIYEEYIEDGSFVKLREVSFSYRFDEAWMARFGGESVTLRVAGRNLYTWTRYNGIDPEINLFSASTVARGVDFGTTPIPREFIASLAFNF